MEDLGRPKHVERGESPWEEDAEAPRVALGERGTVYTA